MHIAIVHRVTAHCFPHSYAWSTKGTIQSITICFLFILYTRTGQGNKVLRAWDWESGFLGSISSSATDSLYPWVGHLRFLCSVPDCEMQKEQTYHMGLGEPFETLG